MVIRHARRHRAARGLCSHAVAANTVTPAFKRGATLVEFFEFPKTVGDGALRAYAVPAFPDPLAALNLFDFDALHRAGFDHMRVPLDVGPLTQGDEGQRRKILEQVVAVVSEINRHGLAALVTLFPPSLQHELPETHLDGLDELMVDVLRQQQHPTAILCRRIRGAGSVFGHPAAVWLTNP